MNVVLAANGKPLRAKEARQHSSIEVRAIYSRFRNQKHPLGVNSTTPKGVLILCFSIQDPLPIGICRVIQCGASGIDTMPTSALCLPAQR